MDINLSEPLPYLTVLYCIADCFWEWVFTGVTFVSPVRFSHFHSRTENPYFCVTGVREDIVALTETTTPAAPSAETVATRQVKKSPEWHEVNNEFRETTSPKQESPVWVLSREVRPFWGCWGWITAITTHWANMSCVDFLNAFPFWTKPMSHFHAPIQHSSSLIKHLLSDCLLCLWFSSIWLRSPWPELILSILCWEITRRWREWEEEEREEERRPCQQTKLRWNLWSSRLSECFFFLTGSLAQSHYHSFTLLFLLLSHSLFPTSSISSSLMRACGVSQ